MTHVHPFRDLGSEQIAAKVFDRRAQTEMPSAATSDAADVAIADAGGYFTGTDVEAALQELGAASAGVLPGMQIGFAYTQSTTEASTSDTSIPADDTIPQNTEGVAYPSLDTTITPTDAGSLLEVEVVIPLFGGLNARFALFRDSDADAIAAAWFTTSTNTANAGGVPVLRAVVAAGSTSATTFKLRWCSASGTAYLLQILGTSYFGNAHFASMTVREIAQ